MDSTPKMNEMSLHSDDSHYNKTQLQDIENDINFDD
jgi:hypothetical protein